MIFYVELIPIPYFWKIVTGCGVTPCKVLSASTVTTFKKEENVNTFWEMEESSRGLHSGNCAFEH
jgi:hypothetical protein